MKNAESWKASKYVLSDGRLVTSNDPKELGVGSRLSATVQVEPYNEHLRAHARGHLLDLGCGKVPFYGLYRDVVDNVTCVDWPGSLHGNEHIDVAADLSKPLPLGDAEYDTIVLSSVLEHLPSPLAFWKEMARVLRPGGKALINVPFLYWVHEAPHDYFRYTEFGLRRMAEESGFDIVLLEALGGAPVAVADNLAKMLVGTPKVGRALSRAVQASCLAFIGTGPGKRLVNRTKGRQPTGYFMIVQKPQARGA
jgi:SAM-dependent methyltransferase